VKRITKELATGLLVLTFSGLANAADVEIINNNTAFRSFLVYKTDQYKDKSGQIKSVYLKAGHTRPMPKKLRQSQLPASGWKTKEFNDSHWPRRKCAIRGSNRRTISLICARTRFLVDDPARAKDLLLSISFRGGAVVYLNGQELTRAFLPKGKITLDTPAFGYPEKAWLATDGSLLAQTSRDRRKFPEHYKLRTRHIKDFKIPTDKLVKGVNLLAIELHRPLTDTIFYDGKHKSKRYAKYVFCQWSALQLDSLTLSSPQQISSQNKPGELRVFNYPVIQRITAGHLSADPIEACVPIKLHGAKNGVFSGKVIVHSGKSIKGLKVTPTALKSIDGKGVIPVESVIVRYGLRAELRNRTKGIKNTFDGLGKFPPAEVAPIKGARALQPVWVTVNVPKDAKAGNYLGKITISTVGAKDMEVPIKLSVANWTIPNTEDSSLWYWMVQSPESLALKYNVKMWSDKHWKLIGESFELMHQLGSRIVYIPMFPKSHLGNEHSMIRWIKDGNGYKHDFSIFEKYMDTALKHLKKIDVVCLYCWPRSTGGMKGSGTKIGGKPLNFTVLDPNTGKLTESVGPSWGQPAMRLFWKPVLSQVRNILKKKKLDKKIMFGVSDDFMPSKGCQADLDSLLPGTEWVSHCHPKRWKITNAKIGYLAFVWGTSPAPYPDKGRKYAWKGKRPVATFPRYGSGAVGYVTNLAPLSAYRVSLEALTCSGLKGFGWIGADFWHVLKDTRGRTSTVIDRYSYDRREHVGVGYAITSVLSPGPNGPVASERHELARQSLQEAAARVFLEKTLADKTKRAKLGEQLAEKCQKLLDERITTILYGLTHWDLVACSNWEESSARLYALTAEAAKKLK
jgi:Glycoside hydrolase 123, catalytic domain/Glycoside hydrolase 123 N-terminal domain